MSATRVEKTGVEAPNNMAADHNLCEWSGLPDCAFYTTLTCYDPEYVNTIVEVAPLPIISFLTHLPTYHT